MYGIRFAVHNQIQDGHLVSVRGTFGYLFRVVHHSGNRLQGDAALPGYLCHGHSLNPSHLSSVTARGQFFSEMSYVVIIVIEK